eukprot:scaffold6329_cov121-Isochrysis_galbana.AAC.2
MKVMVCGPRVPTEISIMIMKVSENEPVEVREVVVDPLLPSLDVGGEVAWQPLQRVDVARRADLGKEDGENRGCDSRASPLGNPFPMRDTQSRAVVIEAFERLLLPGASVEIVARSFNPPLVFDRSYASKEADRARSAELSRLAAFSAAGG